MIADPNPWTIKYVEIGNEDNLGGAETSYNAYRFRAYYDAILAKYPSMTIIASTGDTQQSIGHSATDYHEYTRPDYFVSQFDYWDNRADSNHLTLIGEYATLQYNIVGGGGPDWNAPKLDWPIWVGAVAESVFSLGAERNGHGILGMSYAPGFQNLASYQWTVCFHFCILSCPMIDMIGSSADDLMRVSSPT